MKKAVAKRKTKPAVVKVGKKHVLPGGRWNHDAMADYIVERPDTWIKVGELAKVGCGANSKANIDRVRSRLSQLFTVFRDRGLFLAVEYNGQHHSATAVKLADLTSANDRQCVMVKLDRMLKAREMTHHEYEETIKLFNEAVPQPEPQSGEQMPIASEEEEAKRAEGEDDPGEPGETQPGEQEYRR